jgi:hypothetical protein
MDDFEREASTCRQTINSLDSEIALNIQDATRLEREKGELKGLVRGYQAEVRKRRMEHKDHQRRCLEARRAQSEIITLENDASSLKATVSKTIPELSNVRNALEQCSIVVKEKSLDVSGTISTTDRWADRISWDGGRMRKAREFEKQLQLLQEVSVVLEKVRLEVPSILPSQGGKFLDPKPWKAAEVTVTALGTPMPMTSYH